MRAGTGNAPAGWRQTEKQTTTLHDGITAEQLGKRALFLTTGPFEITAKNIARVPGLASYPFLKVRHPIGSCTPPEAAARATVAFTQGVPTLLERSEPARSGP